MRVGSTPPVMIGDCRTFYSDKRLGIFVRLYVGNLVFSTASLRLLSVGLKGAYLTTVLSF